MGSKLRGLGGNKWLEVVRTGGESSKDAGGNYLPLSGGAGGGANHECGVIGDFLLLLRGR